MATRIRNTTTGTICQATDTRAKQLIAEGHWQLVTHPKPKAKPKPKKATTPKDQPTTTKTTANPTGGAV